jgi:hypothetical protein
MSVYDRPATVLPAGAAFFSIVPPPGSPAPQLAEGRSGPQRAAGRCLKQMARGRLPAPAHRNCHDSQMPAGHCTAAVGRNHEHR